MHGLIFETSICYWQDQPDKKRTRLLIRVSTSTLLPAINSLYCPGSRRPKDVQPGINPLPAQSSTRLLPEQCSHLQDNSLVRVPRAPAFSPCFKLPALVSEISLKDLKR